MSRHPLRVALFNVQRFERQSLEDENKKHGYELSLFEHRLTEETAQLVFGHEVICPSLSDILNAQVLKILRVAQVRLISLRCTGFSHVDLKVAAQLGIPVVHVPEYSPHAVAEHAVALILALDRKLIRAHNRVSEGNFSLDGLTGFDLNGKTVGIIGTGQIGSIMAKILSGFGCHVLANDVHRNGELVSQDQVTYVELPELFQKSDIISLHVPLTPETRHILNADAFSMMKHGVMIINTGRGALIDTMALIDSLKSGKVGSAGLDVYEEQEKIIFQDLSDQGFMSDMLARLMTFPNVLITAHQAFLTHEALAHIARVTFENISEFVSGKSLRNQITTQDTLKQAG